MATNIPELYITKKAYKKSEPFLTLFKFEVLAHSGQPPFRVTLPHPLACPWCIRQENILGTRLKIDLVHQRAPGAALEQTSPNHTPPAPLLY